jgi:solute carrier family 30 (zinc transporter), member 1
MIVGDAMNNIGVMISAIAIWLGKTEGRYYADPIASLGISFMIFLTAIPLGTLPPFPFFNPLS